MKNFFFIFLSKCSASNIYPHLNQCCWFCFLINSQTYLIVAIWIASVILVCRVKKHNWGFCSACGHSILGEWLPVHSDDAMHLVLALFLCVVTPLDTCTCEVELHISVLYGIWMAVWPTALNYLSIISFNSYFLLRVLYIPILWDMGLGWW